MHKSVGFDCVVHFFKNRQCRTAVVRDMTMIAEPSRKQEDGWTSRCEKERKRRKKRLSRVVSSLRRAVRIPNGSSTPRPSRILTSPSPTPDQSIPRQTQPPIAPFARPSSSPTRGFARTARLLAQFVGVVQCLRARR